MKPARTGPKGMDGKGSRPFGNSVRADTSNIVKGKSSRPMGVKRGGSDKKQGPR